MDKYKRLLSNTLIFAIGTFSSKLLTFVMMPFVTWAMGPSNYGVGDLLYQIGNLLLPVVSLGIVNAIIRFGLDKASRKEDVFTTGVLAVFAGFVLLLLLTPLLQMIKFFEGNIIVIWMFVLMSSLRSVCSQFTRARGEVRLYAFDGILSTLTTILFQILLLGVFHWGASGYVLSMVFSDGLSVLFLTLMAKLYRYVHLKGMRWATSFAMLRYSIPMIPNSMFWWVTNVSDRYIVAYMMGESYNGLYAAAYKLPTAISLVADMFLNAWQMSAVTEEKERGRFFTKVFRSYCALLFICAAFVISFSKVITMILVDDTFYSSWQYIPLLTAAIVFACIVTFLGSVYMVEKRSVLSLLTTLAGAVSNVILNILLIPVWGVNGAAFATFASYFLVFVIRAVNTSRYIKMKWNLPNFILNTLVMMALCLIVIYEVPGWIFWAALLTTITVGINIRPIIKSVRQILSGRRG